MDTTQCKVCKQMVPFTESQKRRGFKCSVCHALTEPTNPVSSKVKQITDYMGLFARGDFFNVLKDYRQIVADSVEALSTYEEVKSSSDYLHTSELDEFFKLVQKH